MNTMYPDRDIRQRELIPPEKLAKVHAVVVGVGAIGRQVALQLAATGVPAMDLIDHDRVAVENLAPQGYWPEDLDLPKVDATGRLCSASIRRCHSAVKSNPTADRLSGGSNPSGNP